MQERRILGYINKEDIPSSAIEVTDNNLTSVRGNVVYIPTYLNEGTTQYGNPLTYYFLKEDSSTTVYLEEISGNVPSLLVNPPEKMSVDSATNMIAMSSAGSSSNTSLYFLGPYVRLGSSSNIRYAGLQGAFMRKPLSSSIRPYAKIKFSGNIKITSFKLAGDNVTISDHINNCDPIYIDAE